MDLFKYVPIDLEQPGIRLLRLFKGRERNIECELFQTWLYGESTIPYEALSYTWGDKKTFDYINVNGRSHGITRNLYHALYHMRLHNRDRILWVDAICIDQENERERGHQVQQMGAIYNQAERVIIWLGLPTHETNLVMDSLRRLQEESTAYSCRDWKPSDKRWIDLWSSIQSIFSSQHSSLVVQQRRGIESLLARPWFQRVWILQEVANARQATVCCGTRSVRASFFALAPSLIGATPDPHCQSVLDIMPGPLRKESWWSQKRDLYTLLLKFRGSKASDERDMIYALLGISSDARITSVLPADYTKTAKQVVDDAIAFLFGPSEPFRGTVADLLHELEFLNDRSLRKIVRSYNAGDVSAFLQVRGAEINVTEEMISATAENMDSSEEVMMLLLEKRAEYFMITDRLVALLVASFSTACLKLLLKQRGDHIKITEKVVFELSGMRGETDENMMFLLEQEPGKWEITEGLVAALARSLNATCMETFLKQREDEVNITESTFVAAASNTKSGEEMTKLLLKQRRDKVSITETLFAAAAYNSSCGKDVMALLLEQQEDDVDITEKMVEVATKTFWYSGKEVMALVLKQRRAEFEITEEMITVITEKVLEGPKMMAFLLAHSKLESREAVSMLYQTMRSDHGKPLLS
jgi:hypothetical protein